MNYNNLLGGKVFSDLYSVKGGKILDITNGISNLKIFFEENGMEYTSIHLDIGEKIPYGHEEFDLCIYSIGFEKDPIFWMTFQEMCRVTKLEGYIYINCKSYGTYEKRDFWRFYTDTGIALELWSNYNMSNYPVKLINNFHILDNIKKDDKCMNYVGVWKRTNNTENIYNKIFEHCINSYGVACTTNRMDLYNIKEFFENRKRELDEKLLIKLSTCLGFSSYCDYVLCDRFYQNCDIYINYHIDKLRNLQNGQKLFINSKYTKGHEHKIIEALKEKNIKLYFFIMDEPEVSIDFINLLLPFTIKMFIMNKHIEHPLIHNMPIGIRDDGYLYRDHKGFYHNYLVEEGLRYCEKKYLCLLCFSTFTHNDRKICEDELGSKDFVLNLNDTKNLYTEQECKYCGDIPVQVNYEITHKSVYVLAPRGCGIDTHRFFEAIYLDSIPIVKRTNTPFDKLYNVFPCLIVDEWSEVTKEFLENNKQDMQNKLKEFKNKYPKAFTDIGSIYELLLLT